MTATIISNTGQYPFGNMTNQLVAALIASATKMERLKEAVANASAGYTGTEGTQFEAAPTGAQTNLFGIVPSETPGEQGVVYRYAVDALAGHWETFWAAAAPYIEQLDNGQSAM